MWLVRRNGFFLIEQRYYVHLKRTPGGLRCYQGNLNRLFSVKRNILVQRYKQNSSHKNCMQMPNFRKERKYGEKR